MHPARDLGPHRVRPREMATLEDASAGQAGRRETVMLFVRTLRVLYVGASFASVERVVNTGDVLEVPRAEAQAWIAAGRAVETDAPIGPAPVPITTMPCRHCGGEIGELVVRCEHCGGRQR